MPRHHPAHRKVHNVVPRKTYNPDDASKIHSSFAVEVGAHPPKVDLRPRFASAGVPIYDQGQLNSCTGNALAACVHFDDARLTPSRLFIYYNERTLESDVADDAGACLADGVKALHTQGVCSEERWPYHDDKVKFKVRPDDACFAEAVEHRAELFKQVEPSGDTLKAALATGYPVALGIFLHESFHGEEVVETGKVPMPRAGEKDLGGHAVVCCGYDEEAGHWIMRNSWGDGWGDKGYFYLPLAYLCDKHLATDCWIIPKIDGASSGAGGY